MPVLPPPPPDDASAVVRLGYALRVRREAMPGVRSRQQLAELLEYSWEVVRDVENGHYGARLQRYMTRWERVVGLDEELHDLWREVQAEYEGSRRHPLTIDNERLDPERGDRGRDQVHHVHVPRSVVERMSAAVPVVVALRNVLVGYRHADQRMGPLFILDAVRGIVPVVERACEIARGADRADALAFGSHFMEFCGWLYQDTGDLDCAMSWTSKALDYALELGDQRTIAYTLMRKGCIATESGHPGHGLGMAEAALAHADALTPRLRAVILRQRAHSHAVMGEAKQAVSDADTAMVEAVAGVDQDEDDRAPYATPRYIEMEAGASLGTLGGLADAVPVLEASRSQWPAGDQTRDYALCVSRLATAYAAADQPEQACATAREAVGLAQGLGSYRVFAQLGRLQRRLTRWSQDPAVADLVMELQVLLGASQATPPRAEEVL